VNLWTNSLADVELLQRCIQLKKQLADEPVSTRSLISTFTELERVALRWLALGKRMGLPEDVDHAVTYVMRLTTSIRMLHLASSMMLASNPATVAIGVAGFAMGVISFSDALVGY